MLALDDAGVFEALAKCAQTARRRVRRCGVEKPDNRHRRLLPSRALHLGREQQTAATDQGDELTPLHVRHGGLPCMGLCLSRSSTDGVIFPLFLCSIRKPVSLSRPALRSRRRAQDRRTDLVAWFALARLHLDGSEHDGPLGAVGRRSEGSPLSGRNQSRHNLVSGGSRTRTTMQSCASAAKLRTGGPILPFGI